MQNAVPRPLIFAHRGSSSNAPENTISAFELAVAQGADAIELDVQLSADQQVMVIHDTSVNRTTNGIGRVGDLTLAYLKQLDAGSYFDNAFSEERIPTLNDVFEAVGQKILINIELKPGFSFQRNLPLNVAKCVKLHHMEEKILFSSFDFILLWQIKRLLPSIPCGLLALPGWKGWIMRSWVRRILNCEALHPHYSSISRALVSAVHNNGQRLNVYTVNEAESMQKMINFGVDGIITDHPEIAIMERSRSNATKA